MKKFKKGTLQKTWVVCLLAMMCCFLWGSAFPFIKTGYSLFHIGGADTTKQILFAGFRFTLAGILVILFGSLLQGKVIKPSKAAMPKVVKLAMVQTVLQYIFYYIGVANTTGVKGSVVVSSAVFITILLSSLVFKLEQLTPTKLFGCIVGFGGVILVNLKGMSFDFNLTGDGCIFMSAVAYAWSSILIKKYTQTDDAVMLSGYQFFVGGILMAVGALLCGGRLENFTALGGAVLLYTAFISAVAYTVWGILLQNNPVSKVAIFGFMTPVFGVILSTVILKEGSSFGVRGIVALLLVCVGILAVNRAGEGQAQK